MASGWVRLDGYALFAIAAPTVTTDSPSDGATPIELRRQAIEQQLDSIINSGLDPNALSVVSTLDENSRLPVISVNGQYLMTVTDLDAQLQTSDVTRWANQLTVLVRRALLRAYQERQPRFLMRQGAISGGSILAILVLSRFFVSQQRRLKASRKSIDAESEAANAVAQRHLVPSGPALSSATDSAELPATNLAPSQIVRQQRRNLIDLRLRVIQISQVGLWGGGAVVILGLFPQTRWLRAFLLSTPLQLLGVSLGTYLLIRLSDVLIDQLFKSLQTNEFITPEDSQRLLLRISTVARVAKSTASLLWIGVGLMSCLSLLGVDLLPLLAGAGIIGLALSFAAQSVIKDVINGFLILFEDQYAVGDVITVGNVGGLVENINLRITQLRNSEGMLITIPNSQVSVVQNLSQGWSRVDLTIQVGHSADPDAVLQSLKHLAEEMYCDIQWRSKLLEPPEILGIETLDHVGMAIRIWIKTQPLQQWVVAREFRRRLKKLMVEENLSIGMPQQSLWLNGDAAPGARVADP